MGIIKFTTLRLAIEKAIPFVVFGWSPGQAPVTSSIVKNNPRMTELMQSSVLKPIYKVIGDDSRAYFLENKHFNDSYSFPYNISPLIFLEYDEGRIFRKISEFGWIVPKKTDSNSTNCLLNSFAKVIHRKQFDFHPYAFEIASLVRNGVMTRDEGLSKLRPSEDRDTVKLVSEKLGFKRDVNCEF
jgi:hypothetical protein